MSVVLFLRCLFASTVQIIDDALLTPKETVLRFQAKRLSLSFITSHILSTVLRDNHMDVDVDGVKHKSLERFHRVFHSRAT